MELFSNDQSQLSLVESVYLPDSPSYIPFNCQGKAEELSNEFCIPSYFYRQESVPVSSASSLTETFSSSLVKSEDSQWKKRKQSNLKCLATAQSKSKSKRTKKSSSKKTKMEEKKPITDYILVRARRGQATDSHSLAERVRRERISKRMKALQDLVPGCEKVTGKALILDEIINFVESLKNQVEFLSMKLTSLNQILCDFGLNFDNFTSTPKLLDSNQQLLSSMIQRSYIQSAGENIMEMASSSTNVLYGQESTAIPQDAESYLMQVGDQTELLDRQFDLYSMCSFQQN